MFSDLAVLVKTEDIKCDLFACTGECPKHRFNVTDTGQTGLNALCEGYKMFFTRSAGAMKRMKALLEEGKAPALVMMQ